MRGFSTVCRARAFLSPPPSWNEDMETLGGFRQTMRERSQRPGTRVLIKALRQAGPLCAQILGCAPEEDIWYVRRICTGKREAHRDWRRSSSPPDVVPGFEEVDINLFSVFEVYRWNGIYPVRGEQRLAITHLDPAEGQADRPQGGRTPSWSFPAPPTTGRGGSSSSSRSYTHSDRCEFLVHFQR
ncbi:MAG: UTRA domain-containing protein [Oscillospiraceae bacterium]